MKNDRISITLHVSQNKEFGSTHLNISKKDFMDAGFSLGDSVTVEFQSGVIFDDVPFFNGFYGKTGDVVLCSYQNQDVDFILCNCEEGWEVTKCQNGDSAVITLKEKGKFLDMQKACNISYSFAREDFSSDEVFANFREATCGEMAKHRLYRGCSPIDNAFNRAGYTDKFLETKGVNFVLDLAKEGRLLEAALADEKYKDNYFLNLDRLGRVAVLKVSAAYSGDLFKSRLANGLKTMIQYEGPYFVNCLEGKDRTGFVCFLLQCLMNGSLEDMEHDFMLSYENYYGITKEKNAKQYQIYKNMRFDDIVNLISQNHKVSLHDGAILYLKSCGLSDEEITLLKKRLS